MHSVDDPDFDDPRDQPGFACRRARIGRQAGSQRLGASVWDVPPGETAYPYHFHYGEEEMLVVLRGRPSLRTPEGWRELAEGELVVFLVGEEGAHQVANRTEETVRFLAVSTQPGADVVMYPESGKVGAFERRPEGGGLYRLFRLDDAVPYYEGETPPGD